MVPLMAGAACLRPLAGDRLASGRTRRSACVMCSSWSCPAAVRMGVAAWPCPALVAACSAAGSAGSVRGKRRETRLMGCRAGDVGVQMFTALKWKELKDPVSARTALYLLWAFAHPMRDSRNCPRARVELRLPRRCPAPPGHNSNSSSRSSCCCGPSLLRLLRPRSKERRKRSGPSLRLERHQPCSVHFN